MAGRSGVEGARPVVLVGGLFALLVCLGGCAPSHEDGAGAADQAVSSDPSYTAYAAFAISHGITPRADRVLAIGVRGRDPSGHLHPTTVTQAFDDTLILLRPGKPVVRLALSTHPWEEAGSVGAPDIDGDGAEDIGMIRPGTFIAARRDADRNIAGARTYHLLNPSGGDGLPGDRNTDHDAVYSASERSASIARADTLTAVLFHQAGEGAPALVGCQGLDAAGMRQLAREAGERFDYLLVDANDEEVPLP